MRSVSRVAIAVACVAALLGCKKEPERSESVAVTVPSAEAAPGEKPPAAPAAGPTASVEVGKPAPDFTLIDSAGQKHQLSALRGKNVVLEWFNPDCPFVRFAHGEGPLKELAQQVAGADLVWLSVNSGAPGKQGHGKERNQQALTDYAMKNPILLDEDGSVGRTYGAAKTPHLFLIDAKGVLVYRGGVDNAPMGTVDAERPTPKGTAAGSYVPYLRQAVEELRAGKALQLTDTPPYGCSVKYAS
jgi:peroxiredoxin